jgi:hypothetical protein
MPLHAALLSLLVALALTACGHDARFNENFTGGTPTPAVLELSGCASGTPRPAG